MNVILGPGGSRAVERRSYPLGVAQNYSTVYDAQGSIPLVGFRSQSYAKIYLSQPWVQVVVNKIAKSIAMLPLKVFRMAGQDRELVRPGADNAGKLATLLARPFPLASAFEWKFAMAASLAVYGNALAVKERPSVDSAPDELWPVPWWRVEVKNGTTRPIDAYVIHLDRGQKAIYTYDEVVHLKLWNPTDRIGCSPLEALAKTLAIEDAAVRETVASFENGARPAGVFSTDKGLTKPQAEDIRAEVNKLYGGVDNAYKTAVLYNGLDWKPMAFNHQEQELIPTRKLNREEVCAVYDVNPTQVGILDRATFSNITESHRNFYQDTLGAWLVMMEEGTEAQLIAAEPAWMGLDLEFDLNEVLKGDIAARFTAYQQAIQVGVTPDEIRHLENLPPLGTPESMRGYVQSALQPLEDAKAGALSLDEITVALQKTYLAVGVVLSAEEAREILNRYGANLPDAIPDDLLPKPDAMTNPDAAAMDALGKALARRSDAP